MLILLSWVLMLLTLTPAWYDNPDKSLLQTAGIVILVACTLGQVFSGRVPRITLRQFTAALSVTLMYWSHVGLVTNYVIYLMFLPWIVLLLPMHQVDRATTALLWLAIPAIALQGLQAGYEVYDNSDKITLLFWNPNTFWHHLSALAVVALTLQPRRWFLLSAGFVTACLLFGFSRGAAMIFGLALLCALLHQRPRLLSVLRMVPLVALVGTVALLLIDMQTLSSLLTEYDELVSGRFVSAFNGPDLGDLARGVGYTTDVPLIDIFLWGYSPLFFISMVLLAWSVYPRTEALLVLLIGFVVDSAIYAPVISYLYIAFVVLMARPTPQPVATHQAVTPQPCMEPT